MPTDDLPIIAGVIPRVGGVRPTAIGLIFPSQMAESDYATLMACLFDLGDFGLHYLPIYIGDALNYGELRWGETYHQYADITKIRVELLRDYKWVTSQCPIEIRKPGLFYNHYKAVASVRAETPQESLRLREAWLAMASEHHWSTDELRQAISMARREDGLCGPPPADGEIPYLEASQRTDKMQQMRDLLAEALRCLRAGAMAALEQALLRMAKFVGLEKEEI